MAVAGGVTRTHVDEEAGQVDLHTIVGEILVSERLAGGFADSVGGDGSQ